MSVTSCVLTNEVPVLYIVLDNSFIRSIALHSFLLVRTSLRSFILEDIFCEINVTFFHAGQYVMTLVVVN